MLTVEEILAELEKNPDWTPDKDAPSEVWDRYEEALEMRDSENIEEEDMDDEDWEDDDWDDDDWDDDEEW